MSEKEQTEIIYGDSGEGVSFMTRAQAESSVEFRKILSESKTWGEFKTRAGEYEYEEAVERWYLRDEEDSEPTDETPFNPDEISGYEEGEWPEFPARETEGWVDSELIEKYGSRVEPHLNDSYAVIVDNVEFVADQLREEGYICTRDDNLVWNACYGG